MQQEKHEPSNSRVGSSARRQRAWESQDSGNTSVEALQREFWTHFRGTSEVAEEHTVRDSERSNNSR